MRYACRGCIPIREGWFPSKTCKRDHREAAVTQTWSMHITIWRVTSLKHPMLYWWSCSIDSVFGAISCWFRCYTMAKTVGWLGAENAEEGAAWKQLVDQSVVEGRKKYMGTEEATWDIKGILKFVHELISDSLTCFGWLPATWGINQATMYLYTLVHTFAYPLRWESIGCIYRVPC